MAIIGTISLILAFFLLLVSTTSNIRESVWEYGCLRAIGLSAKQGMRLALYEQYSVILSALILGCIVGVLLAIMIISQFFLFLERPFKLDIPMTFVWLMIAMALITTAFAVYLPVRAVNKQKISSTIKGLTN